MIVRLLLLFTLIPFVELAILIRIGTLLGFWATMGIVLVTGAAGAVLARSQGTRVLRDIQAELAAGRAPTEHLVDGFLILIGGIVLLTPGLLTDIAGLLLLFPPTRRGLKRGLRRRFEGMVSSSQVSLVTLIR